MPEMNGLDLQAALTRTRKAMPVIILTGHGDIPSTVRGDAEGAEDFLEKRAAKEKLLEGVRRAIARDAREHATRARTREGEARLEKLSDREREVLGTFSAARWEQAEYQRYGHLRTHVDPAPARVRGS